MVIFNDLGSKSILAHEFLHAAYARLSKSERDTLKPLLEATYKQNQAVLDEALAVYGNISYEVKLNELHSFIATEVDFPPPDLNEHYNQYFKDRRLIYDLPATSSPVHIPASKPSNYDIYKDSYSPTRLFDYLDNQPDDGTEYFINKILQPSSATDYFDNPRTDYFDF